MADERIPFAERRRCAEFLLTYENRTEVQLTLQKCEVDLDGVLVDVPDDKVVEGEIVENELETRANPTSDVVWSYGRLPALIDDPCPSDGKAHASGVSSRGRRNRP